MTSVIWIILQPSLTWPRTQNLDLRPCSGAPYRWHGQIVIYACICCLCCAHSCMTVRYVAVGCIPEGVAGIFQGANRQREQIYIKSRKGYIRLAIQTGAGRTFKTFNSVSDSGWALCIHVQSCDRHCHKIWVPTNALWRICKSQHLQVITALTLPCQSGSPHVSPIRPALDKQPNNPKCSEPT